MILPFPEEKPDIVQSPLSLADIMGNHFKTGHAAGIPEQQPVANRLVVDGHVINMQGCGSASERKRLIGDTLHAASEATEQVRG